nr:unnamed protein product [Digitaria exilis]
MEPADPATVPAGGNAASASPQPRPSSSLIFLGTGCSGALPDTRCLIRQSTPPCTVCSMGLSLPPDQNPNYRLNTSLLIDYCHDDGTHKYILIDIGKTFREQIILTHEHADAVLGLDEVWVVQPSNGGNGIKHIPIFLTEFTMDSVVRRFPYLVQQRPEDGDQDAQAAKIDWKIIEEDVDKPFVASGLEFVPLPVTSSVKRYFDLLTCLPPGVATYLSIL